MTGDDIPPQEGKQAGTQDDKVVKLCPATVGEAYVVSLDDVFAGAKECDLTKVLVVGYDPNGELFVSCSHGIADALVMLARAHRHICFDE